MQIKGLACVFFLSGWLSGVALADEVDGQLVKKREDTIVHACKLYNWMNEAVALSHQGRSASHQRAESGEVMRWTYKYKGYIPNLKLAASMAFECAYKPENVDKCYRGFEELNQYLRNMELDPKSYLSSCNS